MVILMSDDPQMIINFQARLIGEQQKRIRELECAARKASNILEGRSLVTDEEITLEFEIDDEG